MKGLSFYDVSMMRAGRRVLDEVELDCTAGRLVAVIGPNGAGKSTLLQLAAGLLRQTTGTVKLDDEPMASISRADLARRRAYLPQRAGVEWPISVERVVALGLTPILPSFGPLPAPLLVRIDAALASTDLLHLRNRPATELSGGELARVMLARALVGVPDVLIVDEPTAGLDPRHALDAMARLRANADAGRTVLLAIHELDLAMRFADDIVGLREGRMVAAMPAAEATSAFFSRVFDLEAEVLGEGTNRIVRFTPAAAVSRTR